MIVQTALAALSHFSECAETTGAGLFFLIVETDLSRKERKKEKEKYC